MLFHKFIFRLFQGTNLFQKYLLMIYYRASVIIQCPGDRAIKNQTKIPVLTEFYSFVGEEDKYINMALMALEEY